MRRSLRPTRHKLSQLRPTAPAGGKFKCVRCKGRVAALACGPRSPRIRRITMKSLLPAVFVLLLCSCASTPATFQTSVNGNSFSPVPTSLDDPRWRSPEFYMNDDKSPVVQHAAPQPALQFGSVDGYCAANCQLRHLPASYCAQACAR